MFTITGVSILNIMPDLMHVKHLGTDQYFYGSVLKLLIHSVLPGSQSANLETVWTELCEAYAAHGVQNRFLAITKMICQDTRSKSLGSARCIILCRPLSRGLVPGHCPGALFRCLVPVHCPGACPGEPCPGTLSRGPLPGLCGCLALIFVSGASFQLSQEARIGVLKKSMYEGQPFPRLRVKVG